LAPIALPWLLFLFGRSLFDGWPAYRATGTWPRNEAFLARRKARSTTPH
jgi:hypothetical protein